MSYGLLLLIVLVAIIIAAVRAGERASPALQWSAVAATSVLLLILSGCSSQLAVHGNERGGVIAGDTTPDNGDAEVFATASAHCAKHGKKALLTSIRGGAGYRTALFDCA